MAIAVGARGIVSVRPNCLRVLGTQRAATAIIHNGKVSMHRCVSSEAGRVLLHCRSCPQHGSTRGGLPWRRRSGKVLRSKAPGTSCLGHDMQPVSLSADPLTLKIVNTLLGMEGARPPQPGNPHHPHSQVGDEAAGSWYLLDPLLLQHPRRVC